MTIEKCLENGCNTIRDGMTGLVHDTKAWYNNFDKDNKSQYQKRITAIALRCIGLAGLSFSLYLTIPFTLSFLFNPFTSVVVLTIGLPIAIISYDCIVVGNNTHKHLAGIISKINKLGQFFGIKISQNDVDCYFNDTLFLKSLILFLIKQNYEHHHQYSSNKKKATLKEQTDYFTNN